MVDPLPLDNPHYAPESLGVLDEIFGIPDETEEGGDDYDQYRAKVAAAWFRGFKYAYPFEEESPVDDLAAGGYFLGFRRAMRIAERALGLQPAVLEWAITEGGYEVEDVSPDMLARLRTVPSLDWPSDREFASELHDFAVVALVRALYEEGRIAPFLHCASLYQAGKPLF